MAHPLARAEERLLRDDVAGAEDELRGALERDPGDAGAQHLLGLALAARGAWPEALTALSAAVHARPGDLDALTALAWACNRAGEPELALGAARQALAHAPGHAPSCVEEGLAWRALGEPAEARRAFESAGAFAPARFRLGELLLAAGDAEAGLPLLEARREFRDFGAGLPGEPWDGTPRPDARLLVVPDGRPGDLVFAARFLPALAGRFTAVTVLAPAPLARLLATADARVEIVTRADRAHADLWVPALSLPWLLGVRSPAGLPPAPWLHVPGDAPPAGRARVGVHGAGDPGPAPAADRRVPLAAFAPLLGVPEIEWVSLHDGAGDDDGDLARALPAGGDALDLARAIAGLDAVVATDSLAAHVAVALGVPVCVMTGPAADWRWHGWAPGATHCAQLEPGNWYGAIAAAAGALLALAGEGGSVPAAA